MPPNTVSVARPGPWGNPWTIKTARESGYSRDERATAAWCVSLYAEWFGGYGYSITRMLDGGDERVARLRERLPELRGKNLACWCALDAPCHADVLLELANA